MHPHHLNPHTIKTYFPLVVETLVQFKLIFKALQRQLSTVEKSFGISGSQIAILHEIAKNPNIGSSELSKRLHIHQSTCSLLITKLIKKKLITKIQSKDDHRMVMLKLNEAALKLLKKVPKPTEGLLTDALKSLTSAQLNELKKDLKIIVKQIEQKKDN
jgi:DNA-binding MarR family transcriptional regulator